MTAASRFTDCGAQSEGTSNHEVFVPGCFTNASSPLSVARLHHDKAAQGQASQAMSH